MKRFLLILLALVLVFSMGLAACVPAEDKDDDEQPPPQPQYGGTLRVIRYTGHSTDFGIPWKVGTVDLALACVSQESFLRVYANMTYEPVLAKSWSIAPDRTSITFYLREGVKFHDGSSFNASVAKWNLDRQLAANRSGTEYWESVEVITPYTVRVNLKKWSNTALELTGSMLMLSQVAWETLGEAGVRLKPIGTGPFKCVSHVADVGTRYEKFDDYWREGLPYLDGLWLPIITDPLTQGATMTAGEGDILWTPNIIVAAMLRDTGFKVLYHHHGVMTLFPSSNTTTSPFYHKKVREAVAHAINWTAIIKTLGFGFWEPWYQIALPYTVGYISDLVGRTYDPSRARTLLDEAGYPEGPGGIRFTTTLYPFPGMTPEVLAAVQSYLDAVGISTTIHTLSMPAYVSLRTRTGWEGLVLHPMLMFTNPNRTFLMYLTTYSGEVVSVRRPEGIDSLIEESVLTTEIDPTKARAVIQMVHDDVMVIPQYATGAPRIIRPGVHDVFMMQTYAGPSTWAPEFIWMEQ